MGRTEPSVVKPPAAFRRDARAKRARATINKVIPGLLSMHPRARRGIERSELIVDPPPFNQCENERGQGKKDVEHSDLDDVRGGRGGRKGSNAKSGRRRERNSDEQSPEKNAPRDEIRVKSDGRTRNENCVSAPRITLCVADTLTAAHPLFDPGSLSANQRKQQHSHGDRTAETTHAPDAKHKVGILNMASPLSPGGGFLNGATSQEESLCMRTTLLPALRDEFYRLPELALLKGGSGCGGGDEKDILSKNARWFVDVASAAMLRLPDTTEDGRYASAADRELVVRKMRAVLRVFAARGCSRVVLGAWGCGAYGNPISEVAEAWRRALGLDLGLDEELEKMSDGTNNSTAQVGHKGEGQRWSKGSKGGRDKKSQNRDIETWGSYIEDVVFAIKDGGMAASFARAFGEDVLPLPTSRSSDREHGSRPSTTGYEDKDPVEVARINELREKIAQLEIQAEQVVRSPHLRVGLETVLAGLRQQLPPDDEDGDEILSAPAHEYSSGLDEDDENDFEHY